MHLWDKAPFWVKILEVRQEVLNQHRHIVSLVSSCHMGKHVVHDGQEHQEVLPETVTLRNKVSNKERQEASQTPHLGSCSKQYKNTIRTYPVLRTFLFWLHTRLLQVAIWCYGQWCNLCWLVPDFQGPIVHGGYASIKGIQGEEFLFSD